MILTFLPALRDIRSHLLLQPLPATKQQNQGALGHPRRYVEGATDDFLRFFFPCHLVQCNVSRTLRELMWEDGIGGADIQSAMPYPALSWWEPAVPTHRRLKGSLAALVQRLTKLEKESQEQLQYLEVPCPKALPSLSWLWLRLRTKNKHMGFVPQPGPRRLGPYDPVLRWTWGSPRFTKVLLYFYKWLPTYISIPNLQQIL